MYHTCFEFITFDFGVQDFELSPADFLEPVVEGETPAQVRPGLALLT